MLSQSEARFSELFPQHVERSCLDPEHSFVVVRRIPQTRFAKQTFAQLRIDYVHRTFLRFYEKARMAFTKQMFVQLRTRFT